MSRDRRSRRDRDHESDRYRKDRHRSRSPHRHCEPPPQGRGSSNSRLDPPVPNNRQTDSEASSSRSSELLMIEKLTEVLSGFAQTARSPRPSGGCFTNEKAIPEFDPKETNLSAAEWIAKVSAHARLYGWDERTTLYMATCRLKDPGSQSRGRLAWSGEAECGSTFPLSNFSVNHRTLWAIKSLPRHPRGS
ncbi:uncharacterized protein LOC141536464 [Cotesia typhae]|uniref:uncharacterized protein LOC141531527 n=1 Tax=Cotesia typhae TaxID=2053667 RepID=UPI003D690A97